MNSHSVNLYVCDHFISVCLTKVKEVELEKNTQSIYDLIAYNERNSLHSEFITSNPISEV
jgi:hypothetical protein